MATGTDKQEILKQIAEFGFESKNIELIKFAYAQGFEGSVCFPKVEENMSSVVEIENKETQKVERPLDTFCKTLKNDSIQAEKDFDNGLVSKEEIIHSSNDTNHYIRNAWIYLCVNANTLPNGMSLFKKIFKCIDDINMIDHNGSTGLMHAVQNAGSTSNEVVVDMILSHPKTDVNFKNNSGYVALYWAFWQSSSMNAMKMLLNHPNIDVNALNNTGLTVLMVIYQEFDMITKSTKEKHKLLLKHPKIDFNIKSKEGKTAIEYLNDKYEKK